MRGLSLFIFLTPAFGQFNALTATDDGSRLYFSSVLQLTGATDENSYEKIFVYDGSGFRLIAQGAKTDGSTSNYYHLVNPSVSGDGSITVWVGQADCIAFPCSQIPTPSQTIIQSASTTSPSTLPYSCQLSKNVR